MPRRDQLKPLDTPTLIRMAEVPYIVWGDDESGFVNDLFYVLSKEMVLVTVTMPPGARFRSSDHFRAYFDTHECLYVLSGEYTCQDPETGEVKTARAASQFPHFRSLSYRRQFCRCFSALPNHAACRDCVAFRISAD